MANMRCQICGGTGIWPNCCEFCGMAQNINYSVFKVIGADGKPTDQYYWRVWVDGSVYRDGMEYNEYFDRKALKMHKINSLFAEFLAIWFTAKAKAEVGFVEPHKRVKIQQTCIMCGQTSMIRDGLETCDECVTEFRKKWRL